MSPSSPRPSTLERRSRHQATFTVLVVAVFSFSLLQSLVSPVLSTLAVGLETDQATVTWVLTAYLLSASVATPIVGRIGDRIGKRRMLVVALAALSIGSLIAALAPGVEVMIVARVIQGVGGGVVPLAFGIVRDELPEERVSGAVGVLASLVAFGTGVGLVLAGPIVSALDFRWLFWIPMVITTVAALAALLVVPESPVRRSARISVLPAVLLSAWLVALLLAVSEGDDWGWSSGRTLGLLAAAGGIAWAWVAVERRSAAPLIDMEMMRMPVVWTSNLVALLIGFGFYAAFAFLPQFSQTAGENGYGFGATVTESGLIMLPLTVLMFLCGLLAARLARWIGAKTVVVTGSLVVALGLGFLALAHDAVWQVCVANAVIGAGVGVVYSCLSTLVVTSVPAHQTGVASGMNANIRTIGGSIGAAVMATVVTANVLPSGVAGESGYTAGFVVLAVAMVICALVALVIPRSGTGTTVAPVPEAAGPAPAAGAAARIERVPGR